MRSGTTPVPVKAGAVQQRDLPVYLKAIGTVVPLNTVTVRSRVDGQLLRVAFEEGQEVKKGQLLAEIDPASYKIQVAQAKGQQQQNLVQVKTARSDLQRFQQLHAQTLLTQQQLEQQQALVTEREGALAADDAAVANAQLQLAYTRIEAPIDGRLGLRQVDVGNLIRAGDTKGLVTITQTRPTAVMFTIPEMDLQKVLEPLRAGEKLVVEAWDRNAQKQLATGVLKSVDSQIEIATGTLRLKSEFPNQDELLFPNQFVNVKLRVQTLKNAIVVPGAAVQFGSRGTYVYVVNAKNEVNVRDIEMGPAEGAWQSIVKGLKPGELVVLEGTDRLREGRTVAVVPDKPVAPAASAK